MTLRDFAGLDESVGDVANKLAATDRETLEGDDIGAANRVDLWSNAVKCPSALDEIGKTLGMVVVHVREEDRVQLLGPDSELRQPHGGAAARVELQFHSAAVIGILPVTDKRPGGCQPIEGLLRTASGASQRYHEARSRNGRRRHRYEMGCQCYPHRRTPSSHVVMLLKLISSPRLVPEGGTIGLH